MARYSVTANTTNAPTSTLPGVSLYAAASVALKVREIHIFNTTTTGCYVSVNRFTSAGTQGSGLTERIIGDSDSVTASGTAVQSHTSTPPTDGGELLRAVLAAASGAGASWVFDDEPIRIPAGTGNGLGILCPSGTGQIVAVTFVWEE